MSSHFFFGFGHHATVTSLRFEAGFVGLHGEMHSYNLPFAAALVGLNTLGSQVSGNFSIHHGCPCNDGNSSFETM